MENTKTYITLIGKTLEVIGSTNKNLIGKTGKVTMETKNMIELDNGLKLVKNQILINIITKNGSTQFNGKGFIGRPDARLKKTRGKK